LTQISLLNKTGGSGDWRVYVFVSGIMKMNLILSLTAK